MLNKFNKLYLYFTVCHKWEILKKIEYKIKDCTKYFYLRNRIQQKNNYCMFKTLDFKVPDINIELCNRKYRVFNNVFDYDEINKYLKSDKKFWRKCDINKYKDVKIIWEYNRLQILLPLAIKYIKTKEEKYKLSLVNILDYWKQNNEFEYSINWNSNLEISIRAINICLALAFIQDEELNNKYSEMLYLHAKHIYSEIGYSDCCIPNNHVIGEATALLMLSNFLEVKEKKKWYKKAIKILDKYLNIIDNEGVSKENSFSYQFFVTKMYMLSLCFIKERDFFYEINKKILKSLNILEYSIVNNDEILNYGDNDGGFLFSIQMQYNIVKDIKEYCDLFLDGKVNDESNLYFYLLKTYNNANEIVIGKKNDKEYICTDKIFIYNNSNIILFFNAKDICGHAHNDSLAINLFINGKSIFTDSGTYSYNLQKEKRNYYRERQAHSTIILKEKNAIPIGKFRWKNKNKSAIIFKKETEEYIKIIGIIKKICKREIVIYKTKKEIEVNDFVFDDIIIDNWIVDNDSMIKENILYINNVNINFCNFYNIKRKSTVVSKYYLQEKEATRYMVKGRQNKIKTIIRWE